MVRIPQNDFHAFAEEIMALLNDSDRYAVLSEEAVEQSASWDWDLNSTRVLAEIRQSLA
jgi:hypothetical protein